MPIPAEHKAYFETGNLYHIYNRCVTGIDLYANAENKKCFLQKFSEYLSPFSYVYAWCLLPNHFHFLIEIKDADAQRLTLNETEKLKNKVATINDIVSRRFKNFFIAYSLAYKKDQQIKTNVFAQKFKHIKVEKDAYFSQFIYYIHTNPLHHKICSNWQHFPWSSYNKIKTSSASYEKAGNILKWFGGAAAFEKYHLLQQQKYLCEFDD